MSGVAQHEFGHADEDGTVWVYDNNTKIKIGQYTKGTNQEALDYFINKFQDLVLQVSLLERRLKSSARMTDIERSAKAIKNTLKNPKAVGDYAALRSRIDSVILQIRHTQALERQKNADAIDEVVQKKEQIIQNMQNIDSQDPSKINWKQTSATIEELFQRWQKITKESIAIPQRESDELWARFQTAKESIFAKRKAFFEELDIKNKQIALAKERLISKARQLEKKGANGIEDYNQLLAMWKKIPQGNRKQSDELWSRFKAAGDVLFADRDKKEEAQNTQWAQNFTAKSALLDEYADILNEEDHQQAKHRLTLLRKQWNTIGDVSKASRNLLDQRLKKIEEHVKTLEKDHWDRTDPKKLAFKQDFARKLTSAIADLELKIQSARTAQDEQTVSKLKEELDAKQQWLETIA